MNFHHPKARRLKKMASQLSDPDVSSAGIATLGITETLPLPVRSSNMAGTPTGVIYCLVCNVQGPEHVYWNIHASFTNTSSAALADKMLECVQSGMRGVADLARYYSEYEHVCSSCASQLNLLDEYESSLARIRAEVKQKFWQTFIARGQLPVTAAEARPAEPPALVREVVMVDPDLVVSQAVLPAAVAPVSPRTSAVPDTAVKEEAAADGPEGSAAAEEPDRLQLAAAATDPTAKDEGGGARAGTAPAYTEKQPDDAASETTGLRRERTKLEGAEPAQGVDRTGREPPPRRPAARARPRPRPRRAGTQANRGSEDTAASKPGEPDQARPEPDLQMVVAGQGKQRTDWTEVDKHYHRVVDDDSGGAERFQCVVCHSKIKDRKEIRKHVRRHLGMIKLLKCGFCKYQCYRPSNLAIHERRHTGERPFTCEVCGTGFKSNDGLNVHRRTHTGERPYECELCHKRFTQHSSLQIHKQVHADQKRHICDYCGKSFTQLGNLKCHRRVHTGETPYPCETCGREFRSDYHLKVHQIEHTGRRPYQCCVCQRGFLTAHKLNLHMATHTDSQVSYPCDVCNKHLTTRKSLRDHQRLHTGERPFSCSTCPSTFRTESLLRAHRRQHAAAPQCDTCGEPCRTAAALAAHTRRCEQQPPVAPAPDTAGVVEQKVMVMMDEAAVDDDLTQLVPAVLVSIPTTSPQRLPPEGEHAVFGL